jgi:hypothetical protein
MSFGEAVDQFRNFLRRQGRVGPTAWIVPADVAFWFNELLIRPRSDGEIHAEQLFNRAVQRGLGVSIEAIAKLDHSICCFVFAPDDADDAADHFVAPPLTLKIRQNLKTARQPIPRIAVLWLRIGATCHDSKRLAPPNANTWRLGRPPAKGCRRDEVHKRRLLAVIGKNVVYRQPFRVGTGLVART